MKIGYKEIERRLYNYKKEKANLKNLRLMLENREIDSGLKAVGYGENISGGGISRPTENIVLNSIREQDYTRGRITKLENELAMIENAMEALTDEESTIVKGRYFEGLQWWQVAGKVGLAESHCRRIRRAAIEKIEDTLK